MININFTSGLSKREIINIINSHLDKNADLLIGIDDPEMNQLIGVLVEGVANAIEENNNAIEEQINDLMKDLQEQSNPQGIYPLRVRKTWR